MVSVKKIRDYRELSGLTKTQASEFYCKSKQYYCRLETNDYVSDNDAKEMYQAINLARANKKKKEK
jgi:hypothetical protein